MCVANPALRTRNCYNNNFFKLKLRYKINHYNVPFIVKTMRQDQLIEITLNKLDNSSLKT